MRGCYGLHVTPKIDMLKADAQRDSLRKGLGEMVRL